MQLNLYSKDLKHSVDKASTYKLLQLTPELLEYINKREDNKPTNNDQRIYLKSMDRSNSDVVLVTDRNTFVLRQKMHSNTVLLMENNKNNGSDYNVFSKQNFELELLKSEGKIDISLLPILHRNKKLIVDNKSKLHLTLDEFISISPCSVTEFYRQWYKFGGCITTDGGIACLLSNEYISEVLHILLNCIIIGNDAVFRDLTLEQCQEFISKEVNNEGMSIDKEVIHTILEKFGDSTGLITSNSDDAGTKSYALNTFEIAKWYGIKSLRKFCSKQYLSIEDFLIKWKSQFPPYFPCDIDLTMLVGFYVKDINRDRISYLDKNGLSGNIKQRFKELFKLQNTWNESEIWPFIEQLNTLNLKPESFIMKYARRKRIKKNKYVITSR
ncbi:related to Sister chromatid cohesion protein DCC1 [Saccharomycodes ludwigii]|uniref:Related to Sister chromatid cohesion protein DCC1 n=1 Tax=Saccharomycodes ludwigii TaxID=36035 RepID=A0A376B1N9_9ASCO|nr:hypothetical protein SCDLUD_003477 [Saccharomycodes ludwigii]KAH3900492.1 hypothetical protein SCDLUD_003477 [Saccharomycodes ludwigii]SSD58552.1 related to Sister chromatid cohesion protein DCC1 [Saccharomycodes ludwigii]